MEERLRLGPIEIKDALRGEVEAVVGTCLPDRRGVLLLPTAIPPRARPVISDWNHSALRGAAPAGRAQKIDLRGDRAIATAQYFLNTQTGREAFEVVRQLGDQVQWELGYETKRRLAPTPAQREAGARLVVAEANPLDISPVLDASAEGTGTLSIKDADANRAGRLEAERFTALWRAHIASRDSFEREAARSGPPVEVALSRRLWSLLDHALWFAEPYIGAPAGTRITVKAARSTEWGGLYRPSEPLTIWVNPNQSDKGILHSFFHECAHVIQHHRREPFSEVQANAYADTLLTTYLATEAM